MPPTEFNPTPDELAFLQETTGIADPVELASHVERVRQKALAVHSYPCIQRYTFAKLKVARHPAYKRALALLASREGEEETVLLDVGCCFGAEVRKAVRDGWPARWVLAVDLYPEFWTLGQELFRDTKETMPITFVPGDVFDDSFLSPRALPVPPSPSTPPAPLASLTSLIPLTHRLTAIHAANFFHLFPLPLQRSLAHRLALLLRPPQGKHHLRLAHRRPEGACVREQALCA